MSRSANKIVGDLRRFALRLPEAWEDDPWGDCVVKVRKKIFVFFGKKGKKVDKVGFAVKLGEIGIDLVEDGRGTPTGYGLGKAGWVSFSFAPADAPTLDEMCAWIEESYRAIAPKKLSRLLD